MIRVNNYHALRIARRKLILIFFSMLPSFVFAQWGAELHLGPATALSSGEYKGETTLRADRTTMSKGRFIRLSFEFVNTGSSDIQVFNPFFKAILPVPGNLAIFDSRSNYIGNLLPIPISRKRAHPSNWYTVPAGNSYIGGPLCNFDGHVPLTKFDVVTTPLPKGIYFVQLIYFKVFIASNPESIHSNPEKSVYARIDEFLTTFDTTELFRSNVVKLRIID